MEGFQLSGAEDLYRIVDVVDVGAVAIAQDVGVTGSELALFVQFAQVGQDGADGAAAFCCHGLDGPEFAEEFERFL